MELSKMTKIRLLARCNELNIIKCKTKNKGRKMRKMNKIEILFSLYDIELSMLNHYKKQTIKQDDRKKNRRTEGEDTPD